MAFGKLAAPPGGEAAGVGTPGAETELMKQERQLMERLQRGNERGKYGHGLGSRLE